MPQAQQSTTFWYEPSQGFGVQMQQEYKPRTHDSTVEKNGENKPKSRGSNWLGQ
jgi:hypothetical protein